MTRLASCGRPAPCARSSNVATARVGSRGADAPKRAPRLLRRLPREPWRRARPLAAAAGGARNGRRGEKASSASTSRRRRAGDTVALLLTGPPGIGKTTVIRAVADALPRAHVGGFVTEEIRVRGERRGFALVTFDGHRSTLAHVERHGPPRVGKYGVAVGALDAVAHTVLAVRPNVRLYLVDEIGKMECLSRAFVDATRALLDAGAPLVATVGQRGGGFIAEVKRRADVTLWEITRANRDAMPARVKDWIEHAR